MARSARGVGRVILGGMLALGVLGLGRPADALKDVGGQLHTGMFALAAGQAARLHVVNLQPPDPIQPPGPCRIMVRFFDGQGRLLQEEEKFIEPGQAASFDFGDQVPFGGRRHLRAVVERLDRAASVCLASAEVFDRLTGRTQVLLGEAGLLVVPPDDNMPR